MFESPNDFIGGEERIVVGREARAWANLIRKFNLVDTFELG